MNDELLQRNDHFCPILSRSIWEFSILRANWKNTLDIGCSRDEFVNKKQMTIQKILYQTQLFFTMQIKKNTKPPKKYTFHKLDR